MRSQPICSGWLPDPGAAGLRRLCAWAVAQLLVVMGSLAADPAGAVKRIDGIVLADSEDNLRSAVIAPDGQFAYFGTSTAPGQVIKIDLDTFTPVDSIELASGEDDLRCAVIDPAGQFAYFGTFTNPGRVVKIDLGTFARVDAIEFTGGEIVPRSAVIDADGHFAYFGTQTTPGQVVKIDLDTFTQVDTITFESGENGLFSAVIDPAGQFAYFGTGNRWVVKIDLDTFTRVDAIELPLGEFELESAVVDPAGQFAYFGTFGDPGRVVKIDLDTFTRVDAIGLESGENTPDSAVIDPAGRFAYFGTRTSPGRVVKIDLDTFTRVDVAELASGESSLASAVIDPVGEFAYFGTSTAPGRVVKVGPGPVVVFVPQALDFGGVEVGTTSPPQNAALVNTGDGDATELDFSLGGDDGFVVDTSACGDLLPAGESCEVVVTFAPAFVGEAVDFLLASSAEGVSVSLSLAGVGLGEVLTPVALAVDATPVVSDGNQVFEPGECVEVAPAWLWQGDLQILGGEALSVAGPEGPSYDLIQDSAFYGTVDPGDVVDCRETGSCYIVQIGPSGVARPATHWDATLDEELFSKGGPGGFGSWTLHLGESFVDVPRSSPFYRPVETLLHHGVTGGCADTEYCPAGVNTRGQMPVFMLRALEGPGYVPPACVEDEEEFGDLPAASPFCPWVEELARRDVVAGCGGGEYCPGSPVTRAQLAVVLLKTLAGSDYTPLPCLGLFTDVTCPSPFANWIEDLFLRGITGGCDDEPLAYCPGSPVSRGQMAVFVTRTFGLEIYGP